jgi:hypothetical protein
MGLPPMKSVVLCLALLAAVKLAHQGYQFRSTTRDARLGGAYRGHATEACQREARKPGPGPNGPRPECVASRQRPVERTLPQPPISS